MRPIVLTLALLGAAAAVTGTGAEAQELAGREMISSRATHVVVPQARGFAIRDRVRPVEIAGVRATVRIAGRIATTTLDVSLRNPSPADAEAVMLLPVPDGAAVSAFDFLGAGAEPTARLMRREEARRVYDDIVRRARDPALLEFAGHDLVRSSLFPVPAGGEQRFRVRYEHVLPGEDGRVDYVLPRSESLDGDTPWEVHVEIAAAHDISAVFSPSHEIRTDTRDARHATVAVTGRDARAPGAFRLSVMTGERGLNASLFAYPDPSVGGGYFLLIGGLPPRTQAERAAIRREVTLVVDRSGSMAGAKMDQVRAAALQVVEGLADGESFNLVDYGTTVERFSAAPVTKTRETLLRARDHIAALRPGGGTNLHDALVEALRQPPTEGALPLVLFLTDGLPTVGRTSEATIRDAVAQGNPHRRRIFTFGVGTDVNAPLLDHVAEITRGAPAYVLPEEDVEVAVARVFRRLSGPVLAEPALAPSREAGTAALRELIPGVLPDLFDGDQLVVLGQYRGEGPLRIALTGAGPDGDRRLDFSFDLGRATTRNAFVPRLWASRRIAYLVDQIRQAGAHESGRVRPEGNAVLADPRLREVTDEIVRLSTEFGILSEYTAFLATEGTDLSAFDRNGLTAAGQLDSRAIGSRSGAAGVNQAINNDWGKKQQRANPTNRYVDSNLEEVDVAGVKQIADRALYRRGGGWIDARIATRGGDSPPDRVVEFGSPEHLEIVRRLVVQGRQALVALRGDVVLEIEGASVLVRNP